MLRLTLKAHSTKSAIATSYFPIIALELEMEIMFKNPQYDFNVYSPKFIDWIVYFWWGFKAGLEICKIPELDE